MGKERGTSFGNDGTRAVDVGDGVLSSSAEKAGGDIVEGDLVLVTHPAKGGKGVVDEGDVVEEKGGRKTLALTEGQTDAREGFSGGSGVKGQGRRGEGKGARRGGQGGRGGGEGGGGRGREPRRGRAKKERGKKGEGGRGGGERWQP